jgi:tRNA dimethylallyltransferase
MVQADLTRVVVLAGPTASGKTSVSLALAAQFPLEIVNLDASQLYVGLDIGTAKPTTEERAAAPHHLFDVARPDHPLDAGAYVAMADRAVADITGRGHVPLFVGGTGLYLRALLQGLARIPTTPPEVRTRVRDDMRRLGSPAMHARLAEADPKTATRLPPFDAQRISRALEVFLATGQSISEYQEGHGFAEERYRALKLGLKLPPAQLKERIRERAGRMFENGFVEEMGRLLEQGYAPDLRTFKALGYREAAEVLAGRLSRPDALERVIRRHVQYARRQMTWFRGDPEIRWFPPSDLPGLAAAIQAFIF